MNVINARPLLPSVELNNGVYQYTVIQHTKGTVLYPFFIIPLHHYKLTCSPICNDEIAGACPNMNIKLPHTI